MFIAFDNVQKSPPAHAAEMGASRALCGAPVFAYGGVWKIFPLGTDPQRCASCEGLAAESVE